MFKHIFFISLLLLSTLTHCQSQQPPQPIRNLAFLGSTGNGKSATCNYLLGLGPDTPFKVGHRATGETSQVVDYTSDAKRIRVIDTPGFGDNRFDDARINSVIKQFTKAIVDPLDLNNPKIDAFILVVRLNPRASSLRTDISHARDLFGSVALKSLIMLVIDNGYPGNNYQADDFLKDLEDMQEVVDILKEYKQEEPNKNWFVMWDNKQPRAGQEKELFQKIEKLEPYTHKKFIEADKEIKQRINLHIQEEIDRETRRIKREYEDNQEQLEAKLEQVQEKYKTKIEEIIKERNEAIDIAQELVEKQENPEGSGFNWKSTILAGVVGSRYGVVGAVVSALAVNLIPDNLFDYDISDLIKKRNTEENLDL